MRIISRNYLVSILLSLAAFTIAASLLAGCGTTEPEQETVKDIEIVNPEEGYEIPSWDSVYVVAKFNNKKAELPSWEYSVDDGKTWKAMSVFSKREIMDSKDVDFDYDVHRWVPENDNLHNVEILIKVYSYFDKTIIDKIGPIKIN